MNTIGRAHTRARVKFPAFYVAAKGQPLTTAVPDSSCARKRNPGSRGL